MAESEEIDKVNDQPRPGLKTLFNDPIVKEFVLPLAKRELGIGTHEKEITKKAFGRFMYALRDFIQGTWWVAIAMTLGMGLVLIGLLWIRKMLGV